MNLAGLKRKLEPLRQKLSGSLPLCPWPAVLTRLDPRNLSAVPPAMNISVVAEEGDFKKLRFGGQHEAWFPKATTLSADLWSEYLSVFWSHPANGHYYLSHGTPVAPGDICVDCGACEGFFVFQALAAGAARVVCLEPSPEMAEALRRTFATEINGGRVIIQNAAAGACEGTANFSFSSLEPFGGKVGASSSAFSVNVTTIAKLCADLKLPRVNYIKMDIEGAEIQAVEGAMPLIVQQRPKLAITTYHRVFDFTALRALIVAAGYRRIKCAGVTDRGEGIYRPIMLHAV